MNLAPFEALLKAAIGLDVASIGVAAVERAVATRAKDCNGDWRAYLERLRTEPEELRHLIDAVVVPETWFFRDRAAFETMARLLLSARPDGADRLRLLSIPCASGEEAYSIAITLLEAGLSRDRFEIDALDISPRVIDRAIAAVYGKNAFRGGDLDFRNRYFVQDTKGYRLAEAVRSCVRFRVGNLLDADLPAQGLYDVVFCRNLLIYFDAATQERAFLALARLIRPGGHLFVGPSEANLALERGFVPIKAPMAFAFRKEAAPAAPQAVSAAPTSLRALATELPSGFHLVPLHREAKPRPSRDDARPATASAPLKAGLSEIEQMADAGHLVEAARLCERHLDEVGPSADALVLLGLIRDAAGNDSVAIELYRKALYLDPHHEAALAHLALRLEQQGDETAAARLKERMRRIGGRRAK
jgi:chemotaxis protein methyltransferase WspC